MTHLHKSRELNVIIQATTVFNIWVMNIYIYIYILYINRLWFEARRHVFLLIFFTHNSNPGEIIIDTIKIWVRFLLLSILWQFDRYRILHMPIQRTFSFHRDGNGIVIKFNHERVKCLRWNKSPVCLTDLELLCWERAEYDRCIYCDRVKWLWWNLKPVAASRIWSRI